MLKEIFRNCIVLSEPKESYKKKKKTQLRKPNCLHNFHEKTRTLHKTCMRLITRSGSSSEWNSIFKTLLHYRSAKANCNKMQCSLEGTGSWGRTERTRETKKKIQRKKSTGDITGGANDPRPPLFYYWFSSILFCCALLTFDSILAPLGDSGGAKMRQNVIIRSPLSLREPGLIHIDNRASGFVARGFHETGR